MGTLFEFAIVGPALSCYTTWGFKSSLFPLHATAKYAETTQRFRRHRCAILRLARFKLCPWQRYTRRAADAKMHASCYAPEDYVTAMTGPLREALRSTTSSLRGIAHTALICSGT